jgi:hypothetical protein
MDLRYPIGKFSWPESVGADELRQAVADIAALPGHLRGAVAGLSPEQLDTPYRPGGWTVRQLVHHVADSHMNSYIRFHWALTEDTPQIKAYDENLWAELASARGPIEPSLLLVDGLHRRWAPLLESLTPAEWARQFRHPVKDLMRLDVTAALYAWHGRHHTAHVTELRRRSSW